MAAITLICVLTPPASAQQVPARFRGAADSLAKLVQNGVVVSVAISVSTKAGVIWETAFGFSDRENSVKATALTAYPVASVAKSLTAIGALRAVDRGILDLDRPVSSYLGTDAVRVPVGNAADLTTRRLLHMTAGIPHVVRFYWPDEPRSAALNAPIGHFAAFAPGSQFYYSNQSLGIVGEILARISGKSFDRFMSDEVFRPLGMKSSAVRARDLQGRKRARSYTGKPARFVDFTRLDPEPGAGMYTSAHDLARLARDVLLAPTKFLSAKSRHELIDFSQYPYYSAGWWRDPFRASGLTLVADGAALGHAASLKALPDEGVAVAVLVNAAVDNGFTLGLCDLLLRAAGYDSATVTRKDVPAQFLDHSIAGDTTWIGRWAGDIEAGSARVPLTIVVDSATFRGSVGAAAALQASKAVEANGVLEARIAGALPSDAVAGQPHTLKLNLRRSGDVLTGYVIATGQLKDRPFFMLPYYVQLHRQP